MQTLLSWSNLHAYHCLTPTLHSICYACQAALLEQSAQWTSHVECKHPHPRLAQVLRTWHDGNQSLRQSLHAH